MDEQAKQKEMIRLSISDAGRLFGVNPQTIRRAIANNEITYIVVAGRYKVNFESLVKWSQNKTVIKNKTEKFGIGQYVDRWRSKIPCISPSSKVVQKKDEENSKNEDKVL